MNTTLQPKIRKKHTRRDSHAQAQSVLSPACTLSDAEELRAGLQKADQAPIHDVRSIAVSGNLELHPSGYGFLRDPAKSYRPWVADALVPAALVQGFQLREGAFVRGLAQEVRKGKSPLLQEVLEVEEVPASEYRCMPKFESLTPVHPSELLRLETGPQPLSTRIMDLFAPVGKGQRGLIVAPPRSGKTVLLREIGQAVSVNHPEVKLMMLLVDERPEEVTDMRRQVKAEILASNLDQDVASHVRLSKLTVERGKRLAERGEDVVLLIDSLTRMSRAFNKSIRGGGRTLTGGLDIKALDIPKKLFAAARAFEEGGSLTILATALVETGSRMDDLIFEEFKGTGNLDLVLDRRLAERRIWPAINVTKSGTRRDERLLDPRTLEVVTYCRRNWNPRDPAETMQDLTTQLAKYPSNRSFVDTMNHQVAMMRESA
jgi:transcription termination factor Rho